MTRPLIAVTGATGFIGRRVAAALVGEGYAVRALARRSPAHSGMDDAPDGVDWVRGRLEQPSALNALVKDATAVVHIAGAIKALDRDGFLRVNAGGTEALATAIAAQAAPPRMVLLSSLAAREPRLSAYAASKRAGETVLRRFRDRFSTVILRPPAVYGPGDGETLRIFRMAARGFLLAPPSQTARLSLVHVQDVAGAVLAAIRAETVSDTAVEFDDGKAGGYGWEEVAAAAGSALQRELKLIRVPAPFLYAAGAAGTLGAQLTRRPGVLSWGKVPELLHPDWVADGKTPLTGYKPLWNIEKGFKDAANWYASRGLLIK